MREMNHSFCAPERWGELGETTGPMVLLVLRLFRPVEAASGCWWH